MIIDNRTFVLFTAFSNVLFSIVLFFQFITNKKYKGIGYWVLCNFSFAVAYILFITKGIINSNLITIIIPNSITIAGALFLYIGIVKFFDDKENILLISVISITFLLPFLYFTYFQNNINIRIIIISFTMCIILWLGCIEIMSNKIKSILFISYFIGSVLFLDGLFFLIRGIFSIVSPENINFFTPTFFQTGALMSTLIVSFICCFGLIIMINQRLNYELNESKEYFELMFNVSPDALIITRLEDGLILDINGGFTEVSGYSKEELVGKKVDEIDLYEDGFDRKKLVEELRKSGQCKNTDMSFTKKDKSKIIGFMSSKTILISKNLYIFSSIRDITKRKEAEKAVIYLSYHDQLTGLYNRRFYEQELLRLNNEENFPFGIIMGDVNGLKRINDFFGHAMGDLLLKKTGGILKKSCENEEIIARLGGDEFIILLPRTEETRIIKIINTINELCIEESTEEINISIALGYKIKEKNEEIIEEIFRVAEDRMYKNKQEKRNIYNTGGI